MRGTRAKAIRRTIYGDSGSRRFREWSSTEKPTAWRYRVVDWSKRVIGETIRIWWTGTVTADPKRRAYQQAKLAARGAR